MNEYLAAGIALAVGVLLALLNHLLSRYLMAKGPNGLGIASLIRRLIGALFLLALYFIGQRLQQNQWMPLLAGAIGLTVPMLILTPRLIRSATAKEKGDDSHI